MQQETFVASKEEWEAARVAFLQFIWGQLDVKKQKRNLIASNFLSKHYITVDDATGSYYSYFEFDPRSHFKKRAVNSEEFNSIVSSKGWKAGENFVLSDQDVVSFDNYLEKKIERNLAPKSVDNSDEDTPLGLEVGHCLSNDLEADFISKQPPTDKIEKQREEKKHEEECLEEIGHELCLEGQEEHMDFFFENDQDATATSVLEPDLEENSNEKENEPEEKKKLRTHQAPKRIRSEKNLCSQSQKTTSTSNASFMKHLGV